jgi:RNA polymerase sigma factor (sigma-70 family)
VTPLAVARRPTSAPDGVLVQEAAAGGGKSYAALYDRYAEKVYNYCLRLTGSPDDAADATQDAFVNVLGRLQQDDRPVLDFASYLFAAARNESYALMRRRSRTHPTDEPPVMAAAAIAGAAPDVETDPERALLLRDSQEQVRLANDKLAPRHREVLALREVAERSYDEIGEIMGISENAAAQLLWRARAKMREALTAGAVASVVAASEDCETAQLLISRLQDGEPITDEEHLWLDEHLEECGSCRAARGMLFEVGASYRAWAPVAVVATLRPEVLTQAGHVVGADWSGVAGKAGVSQGTIGGAATGVAVLAAVGIAISGLFNDDAKVARETAPAQSAAKAKAKPKPGKVHALAKASTAESGKPAAPALLAATPTPSPGPQSAPPPAAKPTPKPVKPAPKVEKPPNPPAKPAPAPAIPPPAQTAPTPPPLPATAPECSFPGRRGPGGCPPGHGGTPPGHGGIAPGQFGRT